MFERTIKQMLPATLLNSEIELRSANAAIESMSKAGITPGEASLIFQGFDIRNPEDLKLGAELIKITRAMPEKSDSIISELSQNINANGVTQAIRRLEKEAL